MRPGRASAGAMVAGDGPLPQWSPVVKTGETARINGSGYLSARLAMPN